MEGIQVVDKHLTWLAEGVTFVKIKHVTDTVKDKGIIVQHVCYTPFMK